MSDPVTNSLISPALCISFQGHMLVITNLWRVEIPCHYFFDSKTCFLLEKKKSLHGIYLFSKWKQMKINFALKASENQVFSWNGDILTLRNITLETPNHAKETAALVHHLVLICTCAILCKDIYLVFDFFSSVQPMPGWRKT